MKYDVNLILLRNTGITKFSLVLDKQNGSVLRGQCTLFQCKHHLESSNLILRKMEYIQRTMQQPENHSHLRLAHP